MFRPVAIWIGLRYTRAGRRQHFVSFISLVSMLGIALGVAVLITVLSVLNGFDREIKSQVFGMLSPITISNNGEQLENWEEIARTVKSSPDVTAVAPFTNGQAIVTNSDVTQPTMLIGIIPTKEKGISVLPDKMIQGDLSDLQAGHFNIVLGKELAEKLGVVVGDQLTVATVKGSSATTIVSPSFKRFNVVGVFNAGGGGFGFDAKMAFIHLSDAQTLFQLHSSVTGLHVNVNDIYAAPRIALDLQNQLPANLQAWNWTMQLGDFFENIRLTKTMMFFIFVLIIAVAIFNLICTMVMVVKSKEADIAILRTFGATPPMILSIFLVQGMTIGIGGTLLGILGGVTLSANISAISTWLQAVLHIQLISANVYFVNYLPAQLQWPDVWIISTIALLLCLLATVYPAWNASRIEPVEALRD